MNKIEILATILSVWQIIGLVFIFVAPKKYKWLAAILAGIPPLIKIFVVPINNLVICAAVAGALLLVLGFIGLVSIMRTE